MTRLAPKTSQLVRKRSLGCDYFSFTFGSYDPAGQCKPGNFVHLRLPSSGAYFRRAMSVASVDVNRKELEIIFRVVGHGTAALAAYNRSMPIDILGPLGNRFDLPHKNDTVLIIAGGVGFPPLLYFATELVRRGFDPRQIEFFFGGRTASDILERARLKRLGVHFHPVTDDGSFGRKGLVTDAVEDHLSANPEVQVRLYGCGPEPMLKAVDELGQRNELPGQLSFEAPMPCGFGVCLGCVIPLRTGGHARVCCDGPVFRIGEVAL